MAGEIAPSVLLFDRLVVRLRPLAINLAVGATVILAHQDLLPLSGRWRSGVELTCLILIALTNPPVSPYVSPRRDTQTFSGR